MRKTLFLLIMVGFVLVGCYTNISSVKNKWGPPAKIEYRKDTIVYYYCFQRTGGSAVVYGRWATASATTGWITIEITTDKNGKILSKRKYWKQPDLK